MSPFAKSVASLVSILLLPGCLGTRYTGGVRITPGDPHPVTPEVSFGVHPAEWVPSLAHRSWDAGAGITGAGDHFGFYAEGTGVATQQKTRIDSPLQPLASDQKMIDRTSAGGALRWELDRGLQPGIEARTSNELSGFIRSMSLSSGGVWGETSIGVYASTTLWGRGKWSISTGLQVRTPVVAIDKM